VTEDYGQALSAACPVHPENSRIRRVSVVYETDAPRLLRPGPVLRAAGRLAWAGTLCGVAGAVAIWVGTMLGREASGPALIAALVCFAYALALYGWAAARRATLTIVARGMPGAMAVWRAAWYCDECNGVFFSRGEPAAASVVEGSLVEDGVITRASAGSGAVGDRVITPAAFHRLVWKAGGFPRLAD
jgi:hypothetical protein